jgi:hypothetical protein
MPQPNQEAPPPVLSKTATVAAAGMLVFYALLEIYLFRHAADAKELVWTRYTFLTKGIEAIVFGAAGALFGTKVGRAQTQAAENTTKEAKATLEQERSLHAEAVRRSDVLKAVLDLIDTDVKALVTDEPPTARSTRARRPPPATEQVRSRPSAELTQDVDGQAAALSLLRIQAFAERMLTTE